MAYLILEDEMMRKINCLFILLILMIPITTFCNGKAQGTSESTKLSPADQTESRNIFGSEQVKELQQLLQRFGFDPGAVDGRLGPRTLEALTKAAHSPDTEILKAPTKIINKHYYTFDFRGSYPHSPDNQLQYPDNQLEYFWGFGQTTEEVQWNKSKNPSETFVQVDSLLLGINVFWVRAEDTDGNIDPTPAKAIFEVAAPPPETEITTKLESPIKFTRNINRYTFKFGAQDDLPKFGGKNSQTISYSWQLDGEDWSEYSTTPIAEVKNLTNGLHVLETLAKGDITGVDETPAQLFFEVKIDEQAPQLFIAEVPDPIKTETYSFKLQGADIQNLATELQYSWKLNGRKWTPFSRNQSAVVENLTNGTYVLRAKCKDPDGNISSEAAVIFNVEIDEQIPTIKDLAPYQGILKEPKFTLTLKGQDIQTPSGQLGYSYKLDEEEWVYSSESTISLSNLKNGEHILLVKVRDTHGNESQDYKVSFLVDIPFYGRSLFRIVVGGAALAVFIMVIIMLLRLYRKRKHALKTRYNPYTPGGPVMEKSRFFGRMAFLQEVKASIHNTDFIIMGDNRIGKTSVLHRLADELRTTGAKEYLYLPFYIDISDVTEEEQLFDRLLMETKRQATKYLALDINSTLREEDDYFYRFQFAIDGILKELEEKGTEGRQIRLIFMLDECDVLNNLGLSAKSKIRTIFTQRYAQNVSAILTGVSIDLDMSGISPWWNSFKIKLLTPFTDEEVRTLIKEPAGDIYRFKDEAIDEILNWSLRSPYLVQLLCHEAVNMAINDGRLTITASDIQSVVSRSENEKKAIRKAPTEEEIEKLSGLDAAE